MKLEDSSALISLDAAMAVAKATEFFIESLAMLSNENNTKKTVQKRDLDRVIQSSDALSFLEGSMDVFTANCN